MIAIDCSIITAQAIAFTCCGRYFPQLIEY
jgi:hypothetical protein